MINTQPKGYDTDLLWTVIKEGESAPARGQLKNYFPYLERTGRGSLIDFLKSRYPCEFSIEYSDAFLCFLT